MSQLHMRRANLENLPPLVLPDDYILREYSKGDEVGIGALLRATFGGAWEPQGVLDTLIVPDDVKTTFVIESDGEVVATASARRLPKDYPDAGYVHYVAASPDHAGRKLGYLVSLATLYEFRKMGCTAAVLDTDDFRLPAVKTYFNLGFVPEFRDDTQEGRWEKVRQNMNPTTS